VAAKKEDYAIKWKLCQDSNPDDRRGGIAETLAGADVCVSLAKPGPGTIRPEWVKAMAPNSILMVCANPVPEIWPWEAQEAGARIVATGRSDFPNQVNNSLGFPGIFRGALDIRARTITDEMCLAAAESLAHCGETKGLDENHILPDMDDIDIYPREAVAVALKAQEQGIAGLQATQAELYAMAAQKIGQARDMVGLMMREGAITPVP